MNEQISSYVSDFLLAGCSLLALIIIIPATSASAQQIKPGWRAWVWPLAFAAMFGSSLIAGLNTSLEAKASVYWQVVSDFLLGLAVTLIVLNSIYRVSTHRHSWYFAPFVWLGFTSYIGSVAMFNADCGLATLTFTSSYALILIAIYAYLFLQERERAADALPSLMAATLIILSGIFYTVTFSFKPGWLDFNQNLPMHLLEVVAVFFFLSAAGKGYVVKYALQRRIEREKILVEAD